MTAGLGVAIMAGGESRRLKGHVPGPKALAPFCGLTLLDHQLDRIGALSPERVVVLAHHSADAIIAHLRGRAGPSVEVLIEPEPLGTAGGLHRLPEAPATWLVINVDHVSDVDLAEFVTTASPPCTALLWEAQVPVDEGVVDLVDGRIVAWRERPVLRLPVTTGMYVFAREALARALNGTRRDMPDLVADLLASGVHARLHPGTWFDAGTPERLANAQAWWRSRTA